MAYYWSEPVTDRGADARMTVEDINRIANNINYVCDQLARRAAYIGTLISKTEWTHNDYVALAEWREILDVLNQLVATTNVQVQAAATEATTWQNMNNVEDLTARAKTNASAMLRQAAMNKYVDTEVWAGDGYSAAGVAEPNPYTRIRHYVDSEIYAGDAANCGGTE